MKAAFFAEAFQWLTEHWWVCLLASAVVCVFVLLRWLDGVFDDDVPWVRSRGSRMQQNNLLGEEDDD